MSKCDMISDKLKELQKMRATLAELEAAIAASRNKELALLPDKYGFVDAQSFIAAVKAATDKRRGRKAKPASPGKKRRTRATITDEMRAEVKKLANDGKTGGEIAKAVGISLPSVQNIKKALGLVRKR